MKYSNYKKGSTALRRIINDEESMYSGHFAKFRFRMGERRGGPTLVGIYNAKTDNVLGFINGRGNLFMRPNSIYFDKMVNTKNKVIKHENLRAIRGKVQGHVKEAAKWNILAEKGAEKLIANKDNPRQLLLFKFTATDTDIHFIITRMKDILSNKKYTKKLKNTMYSLDLNASDISIIGSEYGFYFTVGDHAADIERKEREVRVKQEVAETFIANLATIAQDSIIRENTLNPLQFSHTTEDGQVVTGTIAINRLDLAYPDNMPINEWIVPEMVINLTNIQEPLGTLASRDLESTIRTTLSRSEFQAMAAEQWQRYRTNTPQYVTHNWNDATTFYGADIASDTSVWETTTEAAITPEWNPVVPTAEDLRAINDSPF